MSLKEVNYQEPVPFRIDSESENYIRIKYQYIPQNIQGENTVGRYFTHSEEDPKNGYMFHQLTNGETAKFKGVWTDNNDSSQKMQECVLLFRDDEVICVPVSSSLINLRKCADETE